MTSFEYSEEFKRLIVGALKGTETWPNYQRYLKAHLGGPESRVVKSVRLLCPEIEYHCGRLKSKCVLDFGCGTGATTAALALFGADVCAFDISRENMEICRRRIAEHSVEARVAFHCADDFEQVKGALGAFDLVLLNGVVEHIPISKTGLRQRLAQSLFDLLKTPGYLYISDTPNRLWPFDFHSTQLWWIPWTRPGSAWAYREALAKGRHAEVSGISPGPLGLEEAGAWGATYWEIQRYLRGRNFLCLNTVPGHDGRLCYCMPATDYEVIGRNLGFPFGGRTLYHLTRLFEFIVQLLGSKLLRVPITAFAPSLTNLVFRKC